MESVGDLTVKLLDYKDEPVGGALNSRLRERKKDGPLVPLDPGTLRPSGFLQDNTIKYKDVGTHTLLHVTSLQSVPDLLLAVLVKRVQVEPVGHTQSNVLTNVTPCCHMINLFM